MDISGTPRRTDLKSVPLSSRHALLEGFRYLAARRDLVFLILLAGSTAFWGWPFLALLPALAAQFGYGAHGTAWLFSGVGVGGFAAALTVATFGFPNRRLAFIATGAV